MRTNVEKVLERDQKLSELDDRAGNMIICFNICHFKVYRENAKQITRK